MRLKENNLIYLKLISPESDLQFAVDKLEEKAFKYLMECRMVNSHHSTYLKPFVFNSETNKLITDLSEFQDLVNSGKFKR